MESYNKNIAGNEKVELVQVSFDDSEADALKWAKKEKFPWPTVLKDKREATGLEELSGGFVPEYLLLSKDGKVLAKGKEEAFAEAAKLTGKE